MRPYITISYGFTLAKDWWDMNDLPLTLQQTHNFKYMNILYILIILNYNLVHV